jgi:hypothetical protein
MRQSLCVMNVVMKESRRGKSATAKRAAKRHEVFPIQT